MSKRVFAFRMCVIPTPFPHITPTRHQLRNTSIPLHCIHSTCPFFSSQFPSPFPSFPFPFPHTVYISFSISTMVTPPRTLHPNPHHVLQNTTPTPLRPRPSRRCIQCRQALSTHHSTHKIENTGHHNNISKTTNHKFQNSLRSFFQSHSTFYSKCNRCRWA